MKMDYVKLFIEPYSMILILRGHVRDSFDDDNLYNLILQLVEIYPIEIYIHTWNIQSSNVSWRRVEQNNQQVTEERIHTYFRDLSPYIKHIIIDDDRKVQLIGNTEGNVAGSRAPLKGWKYYWYGKYKIAKYLYDKYNPETKPVVSMRFDIFNNSVGFDTNRILEFIDQHKDDNFKMNSFITEGGYIGCDNLYIGSVKTIYLLTKQFELNMDKICEANLHLHNQELLAPLINQLLLIPIVN
jgi:hypothetical protein